MKFRCDRDVLAEALGTVLEAAKVTLLLEQLPKCSAEVRADVLAKLRPIFGLQTRTGDILEAFNYAEDLFRVINDVFTT